MVFINRTHKDLKGIKRPKRQSTRSMRENKTEKKQGRHRPRDVALNAHPLHIPRQNEAFGV